MSQATVLYTSQSSTKKGNNQNLYRSKVRETARKFDLAGKSNDLSPSPVSSHHSSIAIQVNNNNNQVKETSASSRSSSTDSIVSEYVVNPSPIKPKRSLSAEQAVQQSPTHISRARIEIRPQNQHKPTPHQRRTPPATPQNDPKNHQCIFIYLISEVFSNLV